MSLFKPGMLYKLGRKLRLNENGICRCLSFGKVKASMNICVEDVPNETKR